VATSASPPTTRLRPRSSWRRWACAFASSTATAATPRRAAHTCDLGTDGYNLKLSQARAAAVADWLVAHGIARDRLEVRGYGITQPKLPNDSEEHRALNRRIEFRRLTP